MRVRLPLRLPRPALAATLLALAAVVPADAARRDAPEIGVFTTGRDARVDAVLAGIHEGLRLAGIEADVLEKTAAGDAAEARATVKEFAFEGVDVVFALGPEAAVLARDALRETSVVFAAVGYPEDRGLPGRGNVCGVAGGVAAEEIVAALHRAAPAARRMGLRCGDEATDLAGRVRAAAAEDGLAVTDGTAEADVIWIAPDVPVGDVDALARSLGGSRVALIGSTRGHLDAGCSVVLRVDESEQGLHAAALARRILAGEVPQDVGVRRLRRRRLEINLDAARRLGHEIPLPVLAAADHLAPAFGRRR
jgi:putative ABC transport system substrate-binding protein